MQARFASAVLLGFVLIAAAACSSGDERIAELEDELEATQEALEEETEAREEAEEDLADAEQRADDAEEDLADAEQRADDAEQEVVDAEEAQEEAEESQRQSQQQNQDLQQQLTEAQQAELRARASSFNTALGAADAAPGMETATVTWPRGGSLTFRPDGVTFAPGSVAPSVPGGWRSASFTGQTGTADALINDTVYLYTNIQTAGTREFWNVHGLSVTMDNTDHGALASLARGSSATPTRDTTDNTQYTELTVTGSLSGAGGAFTCATCTGTVADGYDTHVTFDQGVPAFSAPGSWTFTPSNIANGYRVDEDDAYLYFGIWSSIPDNITPATAYDFDYIAGGGGQPTAARFNALTGPVTFRGGAVGKYVTQGQVGGQNAKIGTFTATATLNADFDANGGSGTLSGSITDFREGGSPLAGWRVTLGRSGNVGAAADISDGVVTGGANSAVANIGGLSVGGSWAATFYGTDNDDLGNATMYPATSYPSVDLAGMAGWFKAIGANANDASLAGAFAATPQ